MTIFSIHKLNLEPAFEFGVNALDTVRFKLDTVKPLAKDVFVTAATKPAPRTVEPRRALLDASLDLLTAEGLEGFSMREVARRAGVSHQAPYHHFPDREAILAAIVAEGFERLRADSLAATAGIADPARRYHALGRAYVKFALSNPAHFKLMFRSELVREDKHEEAMACAQLSFDVLVNIVDEVSIARTGERDHALIFASWSMVHGLATLMLEGKLDKHFGPSMDSRLAGADSVLKVLERVVKP